MYLVQKEYRKSTGRVQEEYRKRLTVSVTHTLTLTLTLTLSITVGLGLALVCRRSHPHPHSHSHSLSSLIVYAFSFFISHCFLSAPGSSCRRKSEPSLTPSPDRSILRSLDPSRKSPSSNPCHACHAHHAVTLASWTCLTAPSHGSSLKLFTLLRLHDVWPFLFPCCCCILLILYLTKSRLNVSTPESSDVFLMCTHALVASVLTQPASHPISKTSVVDHFYQSLRLACVIHYFSIGVASLVRPR